MTLLACVIGDTSRKRARSSALGRAAMRLLPSCAQALEELQKLGDAQQSRSQQVAERWHTAGDRLKACPVTLACCCHHGLCVPALHTSRQWQRTLEPQVSM